MESDLIPYHAITTVPARQVLVLAPHPDDEVFGCGGAIRSHVVGGVPVRVVILTDGAQYADAMQRQGESRAAAQVVGYGEPQFWGLPDRGLQCSDTLVERIVNEITVQGADLVYAPSPWEVHPDHRQASTLAVEAVRRAPGPVRLAFYEVGAPLRPNVLLDLTQTIERKIQAMQCFASQLAQQDYSRHILALNQFRSYTLPKDVLYAEAYLVFNQAELNAPTQRHLLNCVSLGSQPLPLSMRPSLPLVSVLVHSKGGSHPAETLDCIGVQTYPNIEVLLLESSCDTSQVPEHCGAFPLRRVHADPALDLAALRSLGHRNAAGTYVMWIEAGDWVLPGHIARLADLLIQDPALQAVYSGVVFVNERGFPLGQVFDMPLSGSDVAPDRPLPINAWLLARHLVAPPAPEDAPLTLDASMDFWHQLCLRTVAAHLPGATAVHRVVGPT